MSKERLKISVRADGTKAVIRITGRISDWNNSAPDFKSQMDYLIDQGVTDACIYINSPGGDCFQGNEIANEITRFTGTTTAHLGAVCASAASYIASKCTMVYGAKNVSYMIHKPMMSTDGNSDQIRADLKLLENLQIDYAKTYAAKTGLSIQKIESMWVQDYWMNAEEAKTLGFIDEIEGDTTITEDDVLALKAYKNAPSITASAVSNHDTNNLDKQMKQLLITALAFAATASDAEILAHVEGLKTKAAKADDLQRKLDDLQKESKEREANAEIKAATDSKKITAAQHPFWKKQLLANFDEAKAALDSMPAMVKLSAEITGNNGGSSVDRSTWTYADYQEKDPKALEALAANDDAKFMDLYNKHYGKTN
jgi:ATP-dependent protease ClpP protease subunit